MGALADCPLVLPGRVGENLRTPGKVPLDKFVIHNNLTKDPEAYADKKSQPHVQVWSAG